MKTFALTTVAVLGFLFAGSQAATAGGFHFSTGPYGTGFGYGSNYGYGGWGGVYRPYNRGHYDWHDTSHYDYVPGGIVPHGNHYHYVPGRYYFHQDGHYDYHRGRHHRHHHHH